MAIQKKHGKGRLDKWYRLAKEKGYRARAAFKLIQLNKKYGFLEKSRVLLDLCAAPGSWCQVAAETMPTQSLIVGVDLAPIKPIPRAITFQSDITSDKCRATIRQHTKHLKADTVLHDGAPNVGVAWVQDAFSQAELTLQAMKLATEFLKEGGTFVTKVFRSKDYNALMWVFKQLFVTVEATKPPSSRNVSAEIFVVCRGFKAPKRVDPKFLDPKHVFAELQDPTPNNEAKVFNPEKKKRKREGYEEGDWTQHKEVPVSDFIHTTDPIAILGTVNKLSFEQSSNGDLALAALNRLPETTPEIRQCCADLKVLGKKEFRTLLRWRMKVRDKFGMSEKSKKQEIESQKEQGEEVAEIEPMDEELKIQEELQQLQDRDSKQKRKERRKENERKRKEVTRMQLHMTAPTDIGMEQSGPRGEGAIFNLKSADKVQQGIKLSNGQMEYVGDDLEESETDQSETEEGSDVDGDRLDRELDAMYDDYQRRREDKSARLRAKRARKEKETNDWEGFSASEDNDNEEGKFSDEDDDFEESDAEEGPNVVQIRPKTEGLSSKAAMFFDQDIFRDLGIPEDNDSAIELEDESDEKPKILTPIGSISTESNLKDVKLARLAQTKLDISDSESEDGSEPTEPQSSASQAERVQNPIKANGQLDIDIITAEAMTLAHNLASATNKRKTATDMIDDGFNKHSFRDVDGLPEWFLDDETQHSKLLRPISATAAAAVKSKLRALNARPIKKVREAKARKKMRTVRRLEKLRKQSSSLAEDEGISERDKAERISRMMAKARSSNPSKSGGKGKAVKQQQVRVVVAKGANRGVKGRPRGVKGRYKIVDPRLKKDVRAEKRLAKRKNR